LPPLESYFTDVSETDWFFEAVSFCAARGLVAGIGNNLFAPHQTTTRAMFITVLANFDGADMSPYTNSPFADVNVNTWYGPRVIWAMEKGLLDGGVLFDYNENTFDPNGTMTREQLAVLFDNYLRYKSYVPPAAGDVSGDSPQFSDIDEAAEWAKDSIRAMRAYGMFAGVGNNRFNPKGESTRAEMAAIFKNLTEVLGGPDIPQRRQ
jgi:hypothetical protein